MKHTPKILLQVLTVALPGLLAGCGGTDANGNLPTNPTVYCPNVAVLAEASDVTNYLPGRNDVAAAITEAKITGVAGSCALNAKKQILHVSFKAGFSASNGPANAGKPVSLRYFVSISDGDTIISKTDYTITLSFDGNTQTATATSKTINAEFPNIPASARQDVLVGFALTPAQLGGTGSGQ